MSSPMSSKPTSMPVLSHFSLQDKVIVVTGGGSGIGVEISRGLAEAGADVAIIYSNNKAAVSFAEHLASETGRSARAYRADVTNRSDTSETLNMILRDFGRDKIDTVVANSGVTSDTPALDHTEESWRRENAVNYDGVMWTAQAAGHIFKRQGYGNIVVTGSVSATLVNIPQTQAAYNASKAAVVHLVKSLAVEWAPLNIRVNCISPGFIHTEMLTKQPKERMEQWLDMIPARRICEPAELKSAYVFLAGDSCRYMTGANLIIDGGYTLP